MTLLPGDTLNSRYRIVAIIAEGGMSAVYRAFDETLHIPVAVKESYLEGEEHFRQFRLEATILAGLRHPNLPRVTDHFIIPDQGQYLVMDYIEGEDLRHILAQRGSLPETAIAAIGAAACDALAYLHSRRPPIIHRDVKPGNVKITPAGSVYLVDFGLAKIAQPDQSTQTGAQGLTPGFAPPEQYGQGTGSRSDIYALGATLYAGLCGKTPEDGLNRAMGSLELTPLREHNPAVSERMAAVLSKALAINPEERYQRVEDFREALLKAAGESPSPIAEQAAASSPVTAAQTKLNPPAFQVEAPAPQAEAAAAQPARPEITLTGRRAPPRFLLPALAALFITAGAAAILIMFSYRGGLAAAVLPSPTAASTDAVGVSPSLPAVTASMAALLPSQTAPAIPTQAPTETAAPTSTATPAPTQPGGGAGLIAFASSRGGVPQVWTMNADGSHPRQITSLQDGACQPDWSPDGARIVFISPCAGKKDEYPGASLFIINANGSGLVPLATLPGGDFDPAWSPDGTQIAFASLRDGRFHIFLYTLADNHVTRLSSPVTYERRPAWSPDGKWLAYETNRSGTPQVWIESPDGKNTHPFASPSAGRSTMPAWSPDGNLLVYTQGGNPPFLVSRVWGDPQAEEQRVSEQVNLVENARFSPDGRWVAFNSQQDGNDEIYIMLLSGAGLTRLTDDPGLDFHPAWQPEQK